MREFYAIFATPLIVDMLIRLTISNPIDLGFGNEDNGAVLDPAVSYLAENPGLGL
jgi:hypothetical protein